MQPCAVISGVLAALRKYLDGICVLAQIDVDLIILPIVLAFDTHSSGGCQLATIVITPCFQMRSLCDHDSNLELEIDDDGLREEAYYIVGHSD